MKLVRILDVFNIGILLGTLCSTWILTFDLGSFITLVIAAVLFLGVYGLFLLITKEPLTKEIFNQTFGAFCKRIIHK